MLDAWIGVASGDKLFPAVAEAVANPKCIADGKIAGLQWCAGCRRACRRRSTAAGWRLIAGHCRMPALAMECLRPSLSSSTPPVFLFSATVGCRLARVTAEGHGSKGADSAVRAASVAMQDKASNVREAGTALLTEMVGQLGQEGVVAAAGLLPSPDKKAAMEALSKVVGGPVSASSGAPVAAAVASRPATAAAAKAPAARAGAGSRPGTARPAPAAAAAPAPVEVPAGALLAYSEGKPERSRKVGSCRLGRAVLCARWAAMHPHPTVC